MCKRAALNGVTEVIKLWERGIDLKFMFKAVLKFV